MTEGTRIRNSHAMAIEDPMAFLQTEKERSSPVPVVISESRGHMPVLTRSDERDDNKPIIIINNGGSSLMSTPNILNQRNGVMDTVLEIERNMNSEPGMMLAFSKPGDVLVSQASRTPSNLSVISESWSRIGIVVASDFQQVRNMKRYIQNELNPDIDALPYVFTPDLLYRYHKNALDNGFSNVAAGTKDGVQMVWEKHHVNTPPSLVAQLNGNTEEVFDMVMKNMKEGNKSGRFVITLSGGSAGYGLSIVSGADLKETLDNYNNIGIYSGQRIRIQPYVPYRLTAGFLGTIDRNGIKHVATTLQRLDKNSGHFGNFYFKGIDEYINQNISDDYSQVNTDGLRVLAEAGVVGPVSIDSVLGCTSLIEANIRAGTSWPTVRMQEGSIEGESVHTILTNRKIDLNGNELTENLLDRINKHAKKGVTTVHVFHQERSKSKNGSNGRIAVAFLGVQGVQLNDLLKLEWDVRTELGDTLRRDLTY